MSKWRWMSAASHCREGRSFTRLSGQTTRTARCGTCCLPITNRCGQNGGQRTASTWSTRKLWRFPMICLEEAGTNNGDPLLCLGESRARADGGLGSRF
jgi:hypothetical protein